MFCLLLTLAWAETAEPGEAEASGEAEIEHVLDEASGTLQPLSRKRAPTPAGYRDELLGVAALLGLLLLAKVNRRSKHEDGARRERRTPLSLSELGSSVYEAARSADINLFRDLFLTGGEAARLVGTQRADTWLRSRSPDALIDLLAGIAVRCQPGTSCVEARLDGEVLFIKTRDNAGLNEVAVASVAQVGSAWRLFELASH